MLSLSHRRLLALRGIKGFGLKTFATLYDYFGSLDGLFGANAETLREAGCSPKQVQRLCSLFEEDLNKRADVAEVESWLHAGPDRHLVHLEQSAYPSMLREIHCPPPLIFIAGDSTCVSAPCVAVIGARQASALALAQAKRISSDLAMQGWCVVSGLALGIDAAAHEGALEVMGNTVAVLATGIDRCYPQKHQALAARISKQGAVVAEMPLGTGPHAGLFPRRNRLVSGLCSGVIVIEAGLKSGSLITASLALEQNREVMAMPGQVSNPRVRGCHQLIKQGAALIESAEDVIALLGQPDVMSVPGEMAPAHIDQPKLAQLDVSAQTILRRLAESPSVDFEHLLGMTQLDVAELSAQLLSLEVEGWVKSMPGGYQLAKPVNFAV